MIKYIEIDDVKIGLWTTKLPDDPCVAVNMTAAILLIGENELSDDEKNNIDDLMSSYCSLIDRNNLTGYGENEAQALVDLLCKRED